MDEVCVKVYIRHAEERTVPFLVSYFQGCIVELLSGNEKSFVSLLEENFHAIQLQLEEFALVVDGDLVPVIPREQLFDELLTPLREDPGLVTVNGTRIDKFSSYIGPKTGGIRAYRARNISVYKEALDTTQLKPESHLYTTAGKMVQLRLPYPQCGHEYGQYLWHIYEKAYQRGAKEKGEYQLRRNIRGVEYDVFREGYTAGGKNMARYRPIPYRKNTLPLRYLSAEKTSVCDVEREYALLLAEIHDDMQADRFTLMKKIRHGIRMRFFKR